MINEGHSAYVDKSSFYTMKNVFFLTEESRWSSIKRNSKQDNIAILIDTALSTIERNDPSLGGALSDNDYFRLNLDT